ncbi:hypothetical protein AC579_8935 [Pseudocercospora musae]|uniref:Heme haloperoxidase family profile domain-containing protein n=1 Tax=Pseudocercospora musae TaxID=113226 RepID=A0A139H8P3_9PEZI|nr:hypothetical protein AC579_8935 [Pseudocercospora musae]
MFFRAELAFGATLIASATAGPAASPGSFTNWQAPGPNDVRSPCPALNSLANHGFIPHSGRGMTLPILLSGLSAGLNIGDDATTVFWGGGVLSSPNPLGGQFDLSDLKKHNFPIEHDASLSRQDFYFGNPQPFNQTIFNSFFSYFSGQTTCTIPTTSKAKYSRVQDSQNRNPTFTYGPREFVLSYGEAALFLSTMGNPDTGNPPTKYVKIFFEQERLPYNEGWRRPDQATTLLSLGNLVNQLYTASPEPLPEGLEVITVGAIKDAWEGINPVTGILGEWMLV